MSTLEAEAPSKDGMSQAKPLPPSIRSVSPQLAVPGDPQQGSQLVQAVQQRSWDVGSVTASCHQLLPHMFLLENNQKVLELEHQGQTPPLSLQLLSLLLLNRLFLSLQQLQEQRT